MKPYTNMNLTRMIVAALLLLLAAGCDVVGDDDDGEPNANRVYVANQGNFTDGNGTVSVYDPEADQSRPSAISGLGSIVQSVSPVDDRLYVIANSGNRIDVFDEESLEQVAQIEDVVSPRYLLVDGNTGYVTSLYGGINQFTGGLVTVIDLATNTKVREIEVGDHPEGMALVGTRLHVANHGFGMGNTLHVIDTATQAVVDTVDVECDGPRFLVADADDEVFVFCTGETVWGDEGIISQSDGAVRVLDGATGEILQRTAVEGQIGTAAHGQDVFFAEEERTIFAVLEASTILKFDTDDNDQSGTIGPFDDASIGAVAFDAEGGRLYLGRSNGFTEAGEVSMHTPDGAEIGRFGAGIVPSYISFGRDE